ncbi:EcsC family protein [Janibacter cremeus]|uniref:EcsC family protein n=1 Tax=Janibacter cremeus TaxID=1285192 RepID=UPI0023F711CC|nr:EcsC family protein [Janibacter cremeus]WEV78633.1 EcsC family protein [Janibacter cremeus]
MGFITDMFGRGRGRHASRDTRSALEQAQDPQASSGTVVTLVQNLLDVGIDGRGPFDSAVSVAETALLRAGGNAERAIDDIVGRHVKLAGAHGFVTNLGGFTTMLVALPANVLGFYVLATRMAAAVAHVRGHDLQRPEVRSAVLLSLVGADAQDLLAKAGMVAPGGRLATFATQRLSGPALMVVNKAVGFRILSQAGKGVFSRFGRAVPVVGGAVGAGLDVWLLNQLADHVRAEFAAEAAPGIEGPTA